MNGNLLAAIFSSSPKASLGGVFGFCRNGVLLYYHLFATFNINTSRGSYNLTTL